MNAPATSEQPKKQISAARSEPTPHAPSQAKSWTVDEIGADPVGERQLPHVLLAAVAVFFVLAVAWAAFFEIEEVARSDGRVITRSQVQVITNLEGGIIAEVLVREGDVVQKAQPLVRIDPTRFVAAYREGEQGSVALKAKIARLSAEANGLSPAMPDDVQKAAPAVAQQEKSLYQARQTELASKTQVLRQQLSQRDSELRELQSRAERLAEQLGLVEREIAISAPLVKRGIVSEVELLRLEREQTRTRTDLEQARLSMPRARAAIGEARARVADAHAAFRAQAGAELAQAQADLAKVTEQMPALEDRAARTLVRAPMRGIIRNIPNKTVGGVVQPGSPIVEMVPVEDALLVETHVRPADIAFVHIGQRAMVKISAYDYSIYGALEGKVEYVSADSIVPQQGEPFYVAHVRTNTNAIDYEGKKLDISPGMLASVDVITGRRSVLNYLTKPINRARERALTER